MSCPSATDFGTTTESQPQSALKGSTSPRFTDVTPHLKQASLRHHMSHDLRLPRSDAGPTRRAISTFRKCDTVEQLVHAGIGDIGVRNNCDEIKH